jgi:hypothetical protein
MTNPWFKFYPTDWKADDRLRMCSAGARGLWVEMLCICHQAKPYGYLLVSGQAPTETQLGVLTGIPSEQVSSLLAELETAGVFSRTQKSVIYSRRMVRDEKKSAINRENGKNGGATKHRNNKGKSGVGKRNPSKDPSPRSQKPDIKDEKDRIVFEGNVVRLNLADWDELKSKHDLAEPELRTLMISRDDFLTTLPVTDMRRKKWWNPTMNWLGTQCR